MNGSPGMTRGSHGYRVKKSRHGITPLHRPGRNTNQ